MHDNNNKVATLLQHPRWKLWPGTLTEIAGPAGAGKTQMVLTMCADSVIMHQKAVYVVLGGGPNSIGILARRLETMLLARTNALEHLREKGRRTNHGRDHTRGGSTTDLPGMEMDTTTENSTSASTAYGSAPRRRVNQWLQNIHLHWIRNTEDLMEFLRTSLPTLLAGESPKSVRLVVLDGIAHLFRYAEHDLPTTGGSSLQGREHYQSRSSTFFEISKICKQLSEEHQVPVVVVNQATTRISNDSDLSILNQNRPVRNNCSDVEQDRLEPALGLSWNQCVNSSFFVTTTQATYQPSGSTPVRRRRLSCLKSPHVASNATLSFYIDHRGTVRICE